DYASLALFPWESRARCANVRPMKTARSLGVVLLEAQRALGMSQKEFGYASGASHRTAARWAAGHSRPASHHLVAVAKLLYSTDRALAAEVASHADETLITLGLETPPVPAAPQPPPRTRPAA